MKGLEMKKQSTDILDMFARFKANLRRARAVVSVHTQSLEAHREELYKLQMEINRINERLETIEELQEQYLGEIIGLLKLIIGLLKLGRS